MIFTPNLQEQAIWAMVISLENTQDQVWRWIMIDFKIFENTAAFHNLLNLSWQSQPFTRIANLWLEILLISHRHLKECRLFFKNYTQNHSAKTAHISDPSTTFNWLEAAIGLNYFSKPLKTLFAHKLRAR